VGITVVPQALKQLSATFRISYCMIIHAPILGLLLTT
jgi:hypothetical protein